MKVYQGLRWAVACAVAAVPLVGIPATVRAATITPTLVRSIRTWQFDPGSPDPAGVAYLPGSDRVMIADSEVEETTGAGWHNANLWNITRSGSVQNTGNTTSYTKEPTGLSFDPVGGRLFVSSDSGERVHMITAGGDGRFGTSDDSRQTVLASDYGSTDTEDVAYNPNNGHMYIADGTANEVIDVDPHTGGFGNGDDTWTHFDMAQYGGRDTEGLGYDGVRNTLVVADRGTKTLYETSLSGSLLTTIPLSGISGLRYPADVEIAPASDGSGRRTYWVVDRGVDNGPDPNENDGMLWEVAIVGGDTPPTVSLTTPADGAAVRGVVSLSASASDDEGVTKVEFLVDGSVVATDADPAGGWIGSWDTAGAGEGSHTVAARATDTKPQSTTSGAHQVTVDRTAPGVAIGAPDEGATVSGTVAVMASVTDAGGVASVQFFGDGVSIGTDASSSGGWSVDWNSVSAGNGPRTLTAVATDRAGNTANAPGVSVTVDNPLAVDVPIDASSDDAEQKATNTNVVLNSTDLDMMVDGGLTISAVGLRFTGVNVPSGATVVDAYVQFTTDEVWTDTTNLSIVGDATANPPTFTATKNNILSRPKTAASVPWPAIPVWTSKGLAGPDQRTPDLTPIVQPIVSGQQWVPGNALAFIITGGGRRVVHAYDYGSGVPVLHIEYEIP